MRRLIPFLVVLLLPMAAALDESALLDVTDAEAIPVEPTDLLDPSDAVPLDADDAVADLDLPAVTGALLELAPDALMSTGLLQVKDEPGPMLLPCGFCEGAMADPEDVLPGPATAAGAGAGDSTPEDVPEVVDVIGLGPPAPLDDSQVIATTALGVTAALGVLARLFSRFEKGELLRKQPRADIHALVAQQPGSTLAELARATGLSRGSVVHHCQTLERHGLLASRHDGLNRRFFPVGQRLEATPRPPTTGERRILQALAEQGPLTRRELAQILGITPQAVSYHVLRLQRDGRVTPLVDDGQRRWAAPSEELPSAPVQSR